MGKTCIRFRAAEDLALDVIGETIASVTAAAYIARYEANLTRANKAPRKAAAKTKSVAEALPGPKKK